MDRQHGIDALFQTAPAFSSGSDKVKARQNVVWKLGRNFDAFGVTAVAQSFFICKKVNRQRGVCFFRSSLFRVEAERREAKRRVWIGAS